MLASQVIRIFVERFKKKRKAKKEKKTDKYFSTTCRRIGGHGGPRSFLFILAFNLSPTFLLTSPAINYPLTLFLFCHYSLFSLFCSLPLSFYLSFFSFPSSYSLLGNSCIDSPLGTPTQNNCLSS